MLENKLYSCDWNTELNRCITDNINYQFCNKNLMRQAFIRRAYQIEYHLNGCSEELEFLGDSVLGMMATKKLMKQFALMDKSDTVTPFHSRINEGEFSRMRSHFVCKEYLAARCEKLGLDQFILYGTGEEKSETAKEDALEALIGAVAVDCNYDMNILEDIIDRLVNIQFKAKVYSEDGGSQNYYDIINAWHMRCFNSMPQYLVQKKRKNGGSDEVYTVTMKYMLPEYYKGTEKIRSVICTGDTSGQAKNLAAKEAYEFVVKNGLWSDLKKANVVPNPDTAVNQLQELYQKKFIEQAIYDYSREGSTWECCCAVGEINVKKSGFSKADAKKKAAYNVLTDILKKAGCDVPNDIECIAQNDKAFDGGLKYSGLIAVLNQVEPGKIITEGVMLKWLQEAYGLERLEINWREIPNIALRKEADAPWHRFLTSKGLVSQWYKDKLIEEKHSIVETKSDNWRVLDYKETMVDVKKLQVPDRSMAIGACGNYIENVCLES